MFKKRINKKAVLLKIIFGAMGGGISGFYLFADVFKIEFKGSVFFIFGILAGLFAGLASVPFKTKKIISGIVSGVIAGGLLFLLDLYPVARQIDAILVLFLPAYSILVSLTMGFIDKSTSKMLAGVIGSIVASFICFWMFVIGTVITIGLSWKHPGVRWPMYYAFITIGIVMLLGIGIKECFEDGAKI